MFDFWVVRGDTSAGVMAGELVGVTFEEKRGIFLNSMSHPGVI